MQVIAGGRLPIMVWAADMDDGARRQAANLANLPFAFRHIAIMPDVHEGYGMPIGGVLVTMDDIVIPNAVGVDIGCGVLAARTDAATVEPAAVAAIVREAAAAIPVGFKHNKAPQPWEGFAAVPASPVLARELASARCQLGSLGSGNHFLSIEQGDDGRVWLMVHSGSRNLGLKVAGHYNEVAKKLNARTRLVPPAYDLAALPLATPEGREYFAAMNFCLDFARANRRLLFDRFYAVFSAHVPARQVERIIDIHHNYAAREEHFGRPVIVHRKGATAAAAGQRGVIPGSMGTPSYIVQGLGNPDSFMSCSHGAGRVMSRTAANRAIDREEADRAMRGIQFNGWRGDLSEAPMAYKDIDAVMALQRDLVRPLVKLTPLGVIKG